MTCIFTERQYILCHFNAVPGDSLAVHFADMLFICLTRCYEKLWEFSKFKGVIYFRKNFWELVNLRG